MSRKLYVVTVQLLDTSPLETNFNPGGENMHTLLKSIGNLMIRLRIADMRRTKYVASDNVDGVGDGADARGTVGVVEFLEAAGEEGA